MEAAVAIIGGTGLYELFGPGAPGHLDQVTPTTAFGEPSGPIDIAEIAGVRVAFLPRHGVGHRWPAHSVPYRANMAALADMGVRQVIAPCAVGSLQREVEPGSLVIPDQMVDQTGGRVQTYYDEFHGKTFHAQFAEPYCQRLRESLLATSVHAGWPALDGGSLVVIDGPRFSTSAEAKWYAAAGWSLVNMTGHPEAVLAREKRLCYAPLALVTDYAANLAEGPGVSEAEVYATFAKNTARIRAVLLDSIAHLSDAAGCGCCGA